MSAERWSSLAYFLWSSTSDPAPEWRPSADLYRTSFGWVLKLDLAGVRAEDITLELADRELVIRGCRRDRAPPGWEVHSMEICYSRFERRLLLPCEARWLRRAEIETQLDRGMFYIAIRSSLAEGAVR